jgi:predicted outer membrane repeat protein
MVHRHAAYLLFFVTFILSMGAPAYPANPGDTARTDRSIGVPCEPNVILIKFRRAAADKVGQGLQMGIAAEQIPLGRQPDEIKGAFRVSRVEPVFKDFKRQRAQDELIARKDVSQLSETELRSLRIKKRADGNVPVPELDRVYKLKLELSGDHPLEQIVKALNDSPDVEYAELNHIVTVDASPDDPLFSVQWPLRNTGQMYPESGNYNHPPGVSDADIDGPEAWDVDTGSPNVIVAVVDTGVDYNHRDIINRMWTSSQGYHGYDFMNSDNYPLDDNGHGTHCAGIIAAQGNNGLDIAGVCWNAKIMAIKFMDSTGSGTYANAAAAFYYAADNGADIISNSWGKDDYSQTMQDAVNYAYSQGVIVVAAAGNDVQYYFPHYPASMEHVISVAATDSRDKKAAFSNYGSRIDISAPGVDVLSLRAAGTSIGTPYNTYTTIASGTSMACPHIAGVLALLLSEYPGLSREEILARLLDSADDISAANPSCSGMLGSGRVNACKSLRFSSEGVLTFDRSLYSSSDIIGIQIHDFDIRGTGTQQVTLATSSGDSEMVVLTEEPNRPWVFAGTIPTGSGTAAWGNGLLEVIDTDVITAIYADPNFGDGGPHIVERTANVDCEEPTISDIEVYSVTSSGARVKFRTSEPATASILYGPYPNGPFRTIAEQNSPDLKHDVYLPGLTSYTLYCFATEGCDVAGNVGIDDNSSQYYSLTTSGPPVGIHVPADYATIQAAVNAASPGTTIWLSDGTYSGAGNRNITFSGKSITLRSENGPEQCIIDCGGVCRALAFDHSETTSAVVMGITIRNGYAGGSVWKDQLGGAILCYNSSPTITNCVFKNNRSTSYGGAILLGDLNVPSSSVVSYCTFLDNSSKNGGAIYNGPGHQVVTNCTFKGNLATYDSGGGIFCWEGSYARIENCQFRNNACWLNNRGGAISCGFAYPIIKNCLFVDNFAMGDYYGGGGIYVIHANVTIENCTFYGNTTTMDGGACHFRGNKDVYVSNCIFFNNYPQQVYKSMTTGVVYVTYSDVAGGYSGTGNLSIDPCFSDPLNGDFHLRSQAGRWDTGSASWVRDSVMSPCIDAGNPSSDWKGELWPHGKRINMGSDGGTALASMSNSTLGNIADLNLDGSVDLLDMRYLIDAWLTEQSLIPCDLNRNGTVDLPDFAIFAGNWLRAG